MKVRELIEKLSRVDQELPVAIGIDEEYFASGDELKVTIFTTYEKTDPHFFITNHIGYQQEEM